MGKNQVRLRFYGIEKLSEKCHKSWAVKTGNIENLFNIVCRMGLIAWGLR